MRWSGLLNNCPPASCQGGSAAFSRGCEGVADHVVNTQTGTTSSVQAGWSPESCYGTCLSMGSSLQGWEKHYCITSKRDWSGFQHTGEVACISSADQFWDAGSELRSIPNSSAKLVHAQMLPKYFWTWVVAEMFFLFPLMCKGKATSAAVASTKQNISGTFLQESLH